MYPEHTRKKERKRKIFTLSRCVGTIDVILFIFLLSIKKYGPHDKLLFYLQVIVIPMMIVQKGSIALLTNWMDKMYVLMIFSVFVFYFRLLLITSSPRRRVRNRLIVMVT